MKQILDEVGVVFWLDGATLLGAMREGRFISWDHDVDFTIWKESIAGDKEKLLIKRLREKGFEVGIYNININVRKPDVESVWLDVNLFSYDDTYAILPNFYPANFAGRVLNHLIFIFSAPYHCLVYNEKPFLKRFIRRLCIAIARLTPSFLRVPLVRAGTVIYNKIGTNNNAHMIPKHYFTDLTTMQLYGMEFKVPAETEKYIAFRYGEDWRTPKKDWLTVRDDGAVIGQG
ncbi:LicD family protein [Candidatus Omnitrophota bacterium]